MGVYVSLVRKVLFSSLPFVLFTWKAKQHVRLMEKTCFLMLQNYQIIDTFAYKKDLRHNLDQPLILQTRKKAQKKWIFWTWLCTCCQGTRFQESFTSVLSATLYRFQSNAVIPISQSSSSIYILASSNLWFSRFHDNNKCLVQIYEYDIQISCLKTSVQKKKKKKDICPCTRLHHLFQVFPSLSSHQNTQPHIYLLIIHENCPQT